MPKCDICRYTNNGKPNFTKGFHFQMIISVYYLSTKHENTDTKIYFYFTGLRVFNVKEG